MGVVVTVARRWRSRMELYVADGSRGGWARAGSLIGNRRSGGCHSSENLKEHGGWCWGDPGPDPGQLLLAASFDGGGDVGDIGDPRSRSSTVLPASPSESELLLSLLLGRGFSGSGPVLDELNMFLSRLHLLPLPLPLFDCS